MKRLLATLTLAATLAAPALAAVDFDLEAVRLEHDELRAGEETSVRVVIRNLGPGEAQGVKATLTAGGKTWGVLHARQDVRKGAEITLEGTFRPPTDGEMTLEAVIGTGDADPGNNRIAAPVAILPPYRPDLVVEEFKVQKNGLSVGQEVLVLARVANRGDKGTGGAHVRLEANGKTVDSHRLLTHLKPGNREEMVFQWTPEGDGGPVTLAVVVDPSDSVAEADEENNRSEVALEVAARKYPDLQVVEVIVPQDLRVGTPAELTVRVANRGEAAAFSVPLLLQVDGGKAAERLVRMELPAGVTRAIPLPWMPATAGELKLTVAVDPDERYPDTDRKNNLGEAAAVVRGKPVADLQAVRLDAPEEVVEGRDVRVGAVVRNEGELPAFSCKVVLMVNGNPVATGNSPSTLEPGDEVVVPLKFTAEGPGRLQLQARVLGAADEPNPDDNQATFDLTVVESKRR